jgi:hypothetical protein
MLVSSGVWFFLSRKSLPPRCNNPKNIYKSPNSDFQIFGKQRRTFLISSACLDQHFSFRTPAASCGLQFITPVNGKHGGDVPFIQDSILIRKVLFSGFAKLNVNARKNYRVGGNTGGWAANSRTRTQSTVTTKRGCSVRHGANKYSVLCSERNQHKTNFRFVFNLLSIYLKRQLVIKYSVERYSC